MRFWETHLLPMLVFRASWEVAVTGQPGKTTHATGLSYDFTELFCSKWFTLQVFVILLPASSFLFLSLSTQLLTEV